MSASTMETITRGAVLASGRAALLAIAGGAVAAAPVAEVIRLWSGLGYNRRAVSLQRAAKAVVDEMRGEFPDDPERLRTLPVMELGQRREREGFPSLAVQLVDGSLDN